MNASVGTWHVLRSGRSVGPMSDVELALMARSGNLKHDDFIWCRGLQDWVQAGSVQGLIPPAGIQRAEGSAPAVAPVPAPAPAAVAPRRARVSLLEHYQRSIAEQETAAASRIAASRTDPASVEVKAVEIGRPADSLAPAARPAVMPEGDPSREPVEDWAKLCEALRPAARPADVPAVRAVPHDVRAEPAPAAAPAASGSLVPVPHRGESAVAAQPAAGSSWYSPSELMGADFGTYVADSIVLALVRHDIRNLEDLTSDRRLQAVASYSYECMPGSFRAIIGPTIGRAAVESVLFSFLCQARSRIPPDKRTVDLHAAIRELAASPWLGEQVNELYKKARSGIGSLVSSYMPTANTASAWAQSASQRLAWLNRPSFPSVAQPLQLPAPGAMG